ncbi:MAG: hypothetical protein HY074_10490 [Deltaproteobacteria bacterium]|nr:hypothetical protein [Deltaproteobacteria bacterium]
MKFVLLSAAHVLVFLASIQIASAEYPRNDGMLSGTENIPDLVDAINSRVLTKDLERPENFPAYLYKPKGSSHTKVGRYFIGGKYPTGPIECEHLKMHLRQSDEVLTWESHNTAASNVYYHVHRAIDYYNWLSSMVGEQINQEKKPVGIRLEMDVDWAMWIKFTKAERHNTSQTFPDVDPDKWGTPDEEREIWFFVPKRKYMPPYLITRWIPGIKDTVLGTAGFPLDAARVPTIIYHEWTHLMTRPYLGIIHDSALNEGYSDYYGSVIGGGPSMGDTEEFSTMPYSRDFSSAPDPATKKDLVEPGNFVPRFFWSLRKRFGAARTDSMLWRALKLLTPKSELLDLPPAILKAASDGTFAPDEITDLTKRLQYLFAPKNGRKGS